MKKTYITPAVELIRAAAYGDILLVSDSEIDANDLFEPEVDIDISGLLK